MDFCKPNAIRYICFSYKPFYMQRFTAVGVLFVISSLLFINPLQAQFTKGTRMVGASVASAVFNSGTSDQTITSIGTTTVKLTGYSVNITPSMGWFVSDNTAVGFVFTASPFSEKITYDENGSTFQSDKTTTFNVSLGGFARNYFTRSGSVLPFGQFSFDVGMTNRKEEGFFYGGADPVVFKTSYDAKSTGGFITNAIFSGGITKMVGEHTGLDIYIGYNFLYSKNTMTRTTLRDDGIDGIIDETAKGEVISKYTNHRFLIGIGFQIFLEKRKSK